MKYRKKPVVIEAMQFTNETKDQCFNFVTCNCYAAFDFENANTPAEGIPVLYIQTLEGEMKVVFGDWIIKGINGEFYPCKNDVFLKSYEKVED